MPITVYNPIKMESVLQPPPPFSFENNLQNVTSGNLSKEWDCWQKAFMIYFEACELSNKSQKVQINILLHIIGEKCREVYDQFDEKFTTVEQVLKAFSKYFKPKKNITVERHKFFTREQRELESVEQYAFELNKMAANCEFKDLCNDLIRDRLICGIRDGALRERLLRETDLTLRKAMDISRLAEITRVQAEEIKSEVSEHQVHAVSEQVSWVRGSRGYRSPPAIAERSTRPDRRSRVAAETEPPATRRHKTSTFTGKAQRRVTKGCSRCGRAHGVYKCPAVGQQCHKCNKMNHFSKMCRVFAVQEDSSDQVRHHDCHRTCSKVSDWSVSLKVNNSLVNFKLDTGADVNIIPQKLLSKINVLQSDLLSTSLKLQGYSGSNITVIGKCYLKIIHKNNLYILKFIIAQVNSPPILGREACEELGLIKRVMSISNTSKNSILDEFPDLFVGIGCLPGEYKIQLNNNVKPVIHAPRRLPLALRDQIKSKLTEMVSQGIIAKVEGPTDWVNSITVVKKPNGDLRICLDPQDLNKAIKREYFKLPTFEDLTANLAGAKYFSTLDAKQGFWHVKLHEESTNLCTFSTVFGRYKFLRMPYGISSASEIFHKRLYSHFDDLKGVIQFIDDLLVYGPTKEIHDQRLRAVLQRCQDINIKLNKNKCKICLTEIKYLGHKITNNGIYPDDSHLLAVKNMPTPKNKKDVERFLGLVTYINTFIPNLSEKTSILRDLLRKEVEWHWDANHDACFNRLKSSLTSTPVLQYYTLNKPVVISVDASKNGLGACLMQDNLPVCYASKSLTKTEQSYAQIEKELYACVFACEKFYTYIYGRSDVTIETDHKPLVSIIKKPLANAPARLQRMLLRLQPYAFKLVYKPGKYLYIADTLSRAVAPGSGAHTQPRDHLDAQAQVCAVAAVNPLTDSHFLTIQVNTQKDPELCELIKVIKKGWPVHKAEVSDLIKPYWNNRDELTSSFGIIWKGNKVVIPKCMRSEMLKNIHSAHLGLEKCLLRAREIMFWPNMQSQLKDYLSQCQACLTYRKQNVKEPLMQHDIYDKPWYKVGVDVFHFREKSFVIAIDYYSKYVEIKKLKCLKSDQVISKLKQIFSRHGIPEIVMSDNGPEFSSSAFQLFSKAWHFKHITSSPRYPQSNGQVERAIQTIKNIMKKTFFDKTDFNIAMLEYMNTPISCDIPSPAELLYNRKLRSIVPCPPQILKPKIHKNILNKFDHRRNIQKTYYDRTSKYLTPLHVGQKVKVRVDNRWWSGKICSLVGPRSYSVKIFKTGNIIRRNRRHLIVDSTRFNHEPSSHKYSSLRYDDAMSGEPAPHCSSAPVPLTDTNKYTRYGRQVIPPDRWGFPTSGGVENSRT